MVCTIKNCYFYDSIILPLWRGGGLCISPFRFSSRKNRGSIRSCGELPAAARQCHACFASDQTDIASASFLRDEKLHSKKSWKIATIWSCAEDQAHRSSDSSPQNKNLRSKKKWLLCAEDQAGNASESFRNGEIPPPKESTTSTHYS